MKTKMGIFLILFVAISISAIALNYNVNYTATAPTIDGTIDAVWSSASAAASSFKDNTDGVTLSNQQTSVRLLWDMNNLYILFEADDNAIVAPATANDTNFDFATPQDTAEVIFDPADGQDVSSNDYIYHIAVNPAAGVYTYTEAGENSLGWDLGSGSQIAFTSSGTNWRIEMAIPWSEFNSTLASSPGVLMGATGNGSVWGAQFGRLHGGGSPPNNTVASKWDTQSYGAYFRTRPFGTITFTGGPAATGLNVSSFTPLFTCSFESPTYTAGSTINAIQGWSCTDAATFVATAAEKVTGSQGLEILPNAGKTVTSPSGYTSPSGITVVQYAVKLPTEMSGAGSQYKHVIYINGTTTGYETGGQVWFYGSPNSSAVGQTGNVIRINAYDTSETTANYYYFPGLQTLGDWSYITIKVDESTRKFSVFYNGKKLADPSKPDGEYYIKNHSSPTYSFGKILMYTKNFGTASVFVDDFGQYSASITTVGNWDMY